MPLGKHPDLDRNRTNRTIHLERCFQDDPDGFKIAHPRDGNLAMNMYARTRSLAILCCTLSGFGLSIHPVFADKFTMKTGEVYIGHAEREGVIAGAFDGVNRALLNDLNTHNQLLSNNLTIMQEASKKQSYQLSYSASIVLLLRGARSL